MLDSSQGRARIMQLYRVSCKTSGRRACTGKAPKAFVAIDVFTSSTCLHPNHNSHSLTSCQFAYKWCFKSTKSSRWSQLNFVLRQAASDKALGGAMLLTASIVFVYYTIWAILLVSLIKISGILQALKFHFSHSHSLTRQAPYMITSRLESGQSGYLHSFSLLDWP